jgi:hypothetical protein
MLCQNHKAPKAGQAVENSDYVVIKQHTEHLTQLVSAVDDLLAPGWLAATSPRVLKPGDMSEWSREPGRDTLP